MFLLQLPLKKLPANSISRSPAIVYSYEHDPLTYRGKLGCCCAVVLATGLTRARGRAHACALGPGRDASHGQDQRVCVHALTSRRWALCGHALMRAISVAASAAAVAHTLRLPLLVMQGTADSLVHPEGARCAQRAALCIDSTLIPATLSLAAACSWLYENAQSEVKLLRCGSGCGTRARAVLCLTLRPLAACTTRCTTRC